MTEYIARLLSYPGALQVVEFADGRVQLVGVRARRDGLLVGKELRALREHLPDTETRVAAIYRNDRLVRPAGDTVIELTEESITMTALEVLVSAAPSALAMTEESISIESPTVLVTAPPAELSLVAESITLVAPTR